MVTVNLALCRLAPLCPVADDWESHPDLAEVVALQGRREEDGAGDRDEEEGESSSEPEEERDRDADDDEDDEDEGVPGPGRKDRPKTNLTLNMFSVLGEDECD